MSATQHADPDEEKLERTSNSVSTRCGLNNPNFSPVVLAQGLRGFWSAVWLARRPCATGPADAWPTQLSYLRCMFAARLAQMGQNLTVPKTTATHEHIRQSPRKRSYPAV